VCTKNIEYSDHDASPYSSQQHSTGKICNLKMNKYCMHGYEETEMVKNKS